MGFAAAENSEEQQPTPDQLKIQISILTDQNAALRKQIDERDSELCRKYLQVKMKEYDFQARLMDLNMETFSGQSVQTYIVMMLVVAVVLSGIGFSAFQLWKAMGSAGIQTNSELEMSAKNVRVTSSVVGVVVLTISIVFLYIYTREVYAIKLIDPFQPRVEQPKIPQGTDATLACR
jgi:hypothetical protein